MYARHRADAPAAVQTAPTIRLRKMDGKGEVPTPATCSGDFLAAIEGVLDALRAGMARLHETDLCYRFPPTIARGPQLHLSIWCPPSF